VKPGTGIGDAQKQLFTPAGVSRQRTPAERAVVMLTVGVPFGRLPRGVMDSGF